MTGASSPWRVEASPTPGRRAVTERRSRRPETERATEESPQAHPNRIVEPDGVVGGEDPQQGSERHECKRFGRQRGEDSDWPAEKLDAGPGPAACPGGRERGTGERRSLPDDGADAPADDREDRQA